VSQQGPLVILGVGGGIAAYKACELLRQFTESGYRVRVVPTASALRFVGAPTWAALSGQPVADDVWADADQVPHVTLGRAADLVVVAPATADLLARAAHGLAGDLLTNTLLTARCPVVFAPAMHSEMWEHPATAENVATLRRRGAIVIEPAVGRLTGADTGKGRLPDPAEIFAVARLALARGTAAPLDLAGVDLVRVESTEELRRATVEVAAGADAIVMAAAPADFRPASYQPAKIKKAGDGSAPTLELVTTPDIAAELGASKRPGQVLVAFAAETHDALAHARDKLARKRADLIVVNEVGPDRAFGTDDNAAWVMGADGSFAELSRRPKEQLADAVWDLVVGILAPGSPAAAL